jgi:hypothetical protein
MKKQLILSLVMALSSIAGFSQSEKYVKAMEQLVPAVDSTRNVESLTTTANAFQRIAEAEKTQWLPYYYAALTNVTAAFMMSQGSMGMADKTDPIADKAEALINKADELNKNNSDIYLVKKMIATLRLMGDPMNRYMTYGPIGEEALQTAKKLNPENPRVYLLEGQDKLYTPAEFGGSKTEAIKLFEEALKKYEAYKPESSIHPTWGLGQTKYMITQAQ